ncbi:hypothetical protein FJZ17_02005 [Candidatus Pacearchaeota archaeon]|nr:hypothetical protein [Candidatus Pacearchaeota archaeon]
MDFLGLAKRGILAFLLTCPFYETLAQTLPQEPRLVIYTPGMNFQQLQARYKRALEEALIKAEAQKNAGEIQAIKLELKRLPSCQEKKLIINPEREIGYTGEQPSAKPPFFIETDKIKRDLKIIFKNTRIPLRTNQEVYLNLLISNYKYAGTRDYIEVYHNGKKVGEQEGVREDCLMSIALDMRKLPAILDLELTVQLAGRDLLILGAPNSGHVSHLEIRE